MDAGLNMILESDLTRNQELVTDSGELIGRPIRFCKRFGKCFALGSANEFELGGNLERRFVGGCV